MKKLKSINSNIITGNSADYMSYVYRLAIKSRYVQIVFKLYVL